MKRLLLCIGFLIVISFAFPLVAKQETSLSIEARILALEEQVNVLEQRISRLENSRHPAAKLPDKSDKDALRIERLTKQIQERRDAIAVAEKQIEELPLTHIKLENRLEAIKKKWKLLSDQEHNFLKIIYFAERYPDLGIDVVAVKKELAECKGRKKKAELEKWRLREEIWDAKK